MVLYFLNGTEQIISIDETTGQNVVSMFLENGGLPDFIEVEIFDPKDDKREGTTSSTDE